MSSRREQNKAALKDFLDGPLADLQPGPPPQEEPYDNAAKGESRVILKGSQYRRIEPEEGMAGENESYTILDRAMVDDNSWLARTYPVEHSALSEFAFTADHGYLAIQRLEDRARAGDPLAGEPARYCLRGLERVLDYLDGRDYKLAVKPIPEAKLRETQRSDARQEAVRECYRKHFRQLVSESRAINATAEETDFSRSQVERITQDLRGGAAKEVRETFAAKLDLCKGDVSKAVRKTHEATGFSLSQVRRLTEDLRKEAS